MLSATALVQKEGSDDSTQNYLRAGYHLATREFDSHNNTAKEKSHANYRD